MPHATRAHRILLLVTQADWGGVQQFLIHFATQLLSEGREVLLAAGGEGALWKEAERAGIPTRRLLHVVREINPLHDWRGLAEIQQLIDEWKPNAVHLNSSKMGILGSFAATRSTTRPWTVYRIGGWVFLEPLPAWKRWLYQFAEQWSASKKDVIITVHPGDEKEARTRHIQPKGWISTVPNGLDVTTFTTKLYPQEAARSFLNLPPHAFVFGTIANAYPPKGLLAYLHVLAQVLRKDKGSYGIIVGAGPEFPQLVQARDALDVRDRILLPGHQDHAARLYAAFDAFVLPSLKEGMPWVLLEAMAAHRPIIATDVGACRWMLEDRRYGHAGIIVPPNDPLALEEAMHLLRTHPDEREALAHGGMQSSLQRFSWQETYQGNLRALDRIRS